MICVASLPRANTHTHRHTKTNTQPNYPKHAKLSLNHTLSHSNTQTHTTAHTRNNGFPYILFAFPVPLFSGVYTTELSGIMTKRILLKKNIDLRKNIMCFFFERPWPCRGGVKYAFTPCLQNLKRFLFLRKRFRF